MAQNNNVPINNVEHVDLNQIIVNAVNATKIPDPIKSIAEYSGDKTTLHRWISTVESVLVAYNEVAQHPIYQVWLNLIRNKITNEADQALIANLFRTPSLT